MSQRTIRIASVANHLILENRMREAGILKDIWNKITRKKPKIFKEMNEATIDLEKYLRESHKIDFIKSKLELVRNTKSLIKSLDALVQEIKEIKDAQDEIKRISDFKELIKETSEILDTKEMVIFSKAIAQGLLGNTKFASLHVSFEGGITEPLEGDDGEDDYAHSLEEDGEDDDE